MVQVVSDSREDNGDVASLPRGGASFGEEGKEQASKAGSGPKSAGELVALLGPEFPSLPEHRNPIKALPANQRAVLLDAILSHYENGASIYDLANKLGVNNATIYRNLKKYRLEDWKEIATARYEGEIEEAEKELRTAPDQHAVTRARERLASARWRLERLDRRNYGQETAQGGTTVVINMTPLRPAPELGRVGDLPNEDIVDVVPTNEQYNQ